VSIRSALRASLLSVSAVSSLVSTRAYYKKLPQDPTYPAITLEQISGDPGNAVDKVPALSWGRIRINAWGKTYASADAVAEAVENALNGKKFSPTGIRIGSIVADGMRDFYEPEVEAYYISQDYRIYYEAT